MVNIPNECEEFILKPVIDEAVIFLSLIFLLVVDR
jgi:hypothetical protein